MISLRGLVQRIRYRWTCPDGLAVLGILGLLVAFYPELFLARAASLVADHWEQHYPWAFYTAKSLRQGILPFWTPLIQCGFPIAAESQIGLFYLPNLLLYVVLPIRWAYAYMNIVHFFIAATGTYFYARKMGLNFWGSMVAMIVFVFGAGDGGAFYNITSLKTLAWFPWILWAFEGFQESSRKGYVLSAALFMAFSILAGYLQIAALVLTICLSYFLFRVCFFCRVPLTGGYFLKAGGVMALAFLGAVVLALPQLILTYELSLLSNRVGLSEGYAYVGSLSPAALLTVFFPKMQGLFRSACLYSGIFALIFITASFFASTEKNRKILLLWLTLGVVSLLLALGQWSPLYVGLVKLSHFYAFRIPAKFLIFFCFSAAMLAGTGFHVISVDMMEDPVRRDVFVNLYLVLSLGILALWGCVLFCLSWGRTLVFSVGKWAVENFIFGKSGHPRSLDYYYKFLDASIDSARNILSLNDPWQVWAIVLISLSCVWCMFFRRRFRPALLFSTAIIFLLADLYAFATIDIKKDFADYKDVLGPHIIVSVLLSEQTSGRLGRIYGYRKESEWLPLVPSVNMLYDIEDIGGYSPLIMSRYYETIGQFGSVNDSNHMSEPGTAFVLERLPLLNALDVSHVLAARALNHPNLELLVRDPRSGVFFYRNLGKRTRAFFVGGSVRFLIWRDLKATFMAPGFDPQEDLLLEPDEKATAEGVRLNTGSKATRILRMLQKDRSERWIVTVTGPGFFIVMNTMYPGWEARVNGIASPVLRAYGLFQALPIAAAGTYTVELTYHPYHSLRKEF